MTAKTIAAVGLAGLGCIALFLFSTREKLPEASPIAPEIQEPTRPTITSSVKSSANPDSLAAPATPSPAPPNVVSAADPEEKISALENLGTHSDPESLQLIARELVNSSPEIRKAARDAIIQFGSRDAIPILKDLAGKTEDAREKVELLDAIEFLSLPTLSELRQKQRAGSTSEPPSTVK